MHVKRWLDTIIRQVDDGGSTPSTRYLVWRMKSQLAFNPRRMLGSLSAVITLHLYSHCPPHWNSSLADARNRMARDTPDIQTSTKLDKWFCQHLKKTKNKITTRGDAEEWEACPCLPLNWSHNSVPSLATSRGGADPKLVCVWCYRNNFCFPPIHRVLPQLKVSCKLLCVMRVISLTIILYTAFLTTISCLDDEVTFCFLMPLSSYRPYEWGTVTIWL